MELGWLLCRTYWLTLAAATSSCRSIRRSDTRIHRRKRRTGDWFDPSTQNDCMCECFLTMLKHHQHNRVGQDKSSLEGQWGPTQSGSCGP
eukprot:6209963-Amphidinium_carterae.2